MPLVPCSSDVLAKPKLADEKCTRTYIFHQYRHGWRWFYAVATFWQAEPAETRVQELTRMSILGHSHTKAKIEVAPIGVEAVPKTDDAAERVVVPAAAAYDAEITRSSRCTLRVGYKSAGFVSAVVCCRIIIIPVKTPFPDVPAHIV